MHRPQPPPWPGEPVRRAPGNPHSLATAGGQGKALATGDVDERQDDLALARAAIGVLEQPLPGPLDAAARPRSVQAPGKRGDFPSLVHRALSLVSPEYRHGNLPADTPSTVRLAMEADALSPARLELWRALDRFEDKLHILSDMFFFGRCPSPWRDAGIRDAAEAVAREEGLGEEQVVRGLLADAYGRAGRPRDEWFPHSARRVAGALPRQLEPLDPEVVERERSKGIRLSDMDAPRAPDLQETEYNEPGNGEPRRYGLPQIIHPGLKSQAPDSSND